MFSTASKRQLPLSFIDWEYSGPLSWKSGLTSWAFLSPYNLGKQLLKSIGSFIILRARSCEPWVLSCLINPTSSNFLKKNGTKQSHKNKARKPKRRNDFNVRWVFWLYQALHSLGLFIESFGLGPASLQNPFQHIPLCCALRLLNRNIFPFRHFLGSSLALLVEQKTPGLNEKLASALNSCSFLALVCGRRNPRKSPNLAPLLHKSQPK